MDISSQGRPRPNVRTHVPTLRFLAIGTAGSSAAPAPSGRAARCTFSPRPTSVSLRQTSRARGQRPACGAPGALSARPSTNRPPQHPDRPTGLLTGLRAHLTPSKRTCPLGRRRRLHRIRPRRSLATMAENTPHQGGPYEQHIPRCVSRERRRARHVVIQRGGGDQGVLTGKAASGRWTAARMEPAGG